MKFKPGDLVDAWSFRAVVVSATDTWVWVRYPPDCHDQFLAGYMEGFPPEMLSMWHDPHPFSAN